MFGLQTLMPGKATAKAAIVDGIRLCAIPADVRADAALRALSTRERRPSGNPYNVPTIGSVGAMVS
jgi:hypothetical protein